MENMWRCWSFWKTYVIFGSRRINLGVALIPVHIRMPTLARQPKVSLTLLQPLKWYEGYTWHNYSELRGHDMDLYALCTSSYSSCICSLCFSFIWCKNASSSSSIQPNLLGPHHLQGACNELWKDWARGSRACYEREATSQYASFAQLAGASSHHGMKILMAHSCWFGCATSMNWFCNFNWFD